MGKMIVISKEITTSKLWGVSLQDFFILRNSFLADIKMNVNKTFVMDSKGKKPAIPVYILYAKRYKWAKSCSVMYTQTPDFIT